jgi:streptogramin lyase
VARTHASEPSPRRAAPSATRGIAAIASRIALLGASIVLLGAGAATADPLGTIEHFSKGLSTGELAGAIAAGPEGNMWFTEAGAHPAIGRITPTGQITLFSAGLDTGAELGGIALGPDGNIWFTEAGPHPAIGRITPTGAITEFSSGLSHPPEDIAAGPDGNLWFTEPAGAIGRITPGGQITEYTAGLNPESSPIDIAAGPDGNLWFTDQGQTRAIGRITPGGQIEEFSKGLRRVGGESRPLDITAGPDGNMWFTDAAEHGALIGRISPSDPVPIKEFDPNYERVMDIAAGPEGDLWFTGLKEYDPETELSPALVQITTGGQVERSIESLVRGEATVGVAPGPDGNIWFTEQEPAEPTVPDHQAIGLLGVGAPPALQTPPTVAGSGQAGSALTCQGAAWSPWAGPEPSLLEFGFDGYHWLLAGNAIPGQTGQEFTPTAADVGAQISCSVTVTYPLLAVTVSAASASVTIAPAAVIPPVAPTPEPEPEPAAVVEIPGQTDRVAASGALNVTVDCTSAPCSGSIELLAKIRKRTGRGRKRRTKTVSTKLAAAAFSDLSIGVDKVSLKLDSTGQALLRHDRYELTGIASARYLSSGSTYAVATGAVKLRGKKPRKR